MANSTVSPPVVDFEHSTGASVIFINSFGGKAIFTISSHNSVVLAINSLHQFLNHVFQTENLEGNLEEKVVVVVF